MAEKMGEGMPTMGRQVVFYVPSQPEGAPAIVTAVDDEGQGILSLFVMTRGDAFNRSGVWPYEYEEGDDDGDKIGFWEWPDRA